MKRARFLVVAAAALIVLAAGPLRAQFGALEGDLRDENGKSMSGTRIVIERVDIKGKYTLAEKDTKNGHYYYGGLPSGGVYNITWFQGDQQLDGMDNVKVLSGDPTVVNFDLRKAKERQAGGSGQLSKEQRAKIEEQLKQREAQKQKMDKLGKSFSTGVDALKAAKDQSVLIAQAGIQVQPGQVMTPEIRSAIEAQKIKSLEAALQAFQDAAQADPTQDAVFYNLAETWVETARTKRGDESQAAYKNALDNYRKAIVLKPNEAVYHLNLGSALANLGQMDEATKELNTAAQLDPAQAGRAYFNVGVVLVNSGKMKEAVGPLKKAIEVDPKYADAWYWLGMALSGDAKVDVATGKITPAEGTMEAFQKCLTLDPDGKYAETAKAMLQQLGGTVTTEIKAEKKAVKKK